MLKSWFVVCEVNMDKSIEAKQIVHAYTEEEAKSFSVNGLLKKGYSMVTVKSCYEIR